jgi:hypothetical protein
MPVAETVPAEPNGVQPNGVQPHELEGGELEQLVVKSEPQVSLGNGEKPKRRRTPKAAIAEVTPEVAQAQAALATEPAPKPKRVRSPRKPAAPAEADS